MKNAPKTKAEENQETLTVWFKAIVLTIIGLLIASLCEN